MKSTLSDKLFNIFNIGFLLIFSVSCIFPLWHVICQSFSNTILVSTKDVSIWPLEFTWANYKSIFNDTRLMNAFFISVMRTLTAASLSVFLNALAAYPLSKSKLIFKKSITTFILITMYFGGGLVPFYVLLNNLRLIDTFWVFIIPGIYAGGTIIIMRTFFKNLPAELEESATLDGANDLIIFFKIYFPLSKPLLATMFLFSAVGNWNDWFAGEIFIRKESLKPLSTILMIPFL
jgi:putative aldouronate transport system permease protein